jgi:hypothetical protein
LIKAVTRSTVVLSVQDKYELSKKNHLSKPFKAWFLNVLNIIRMLHFELFVLKAKTGELCEKQPCSSC